MRGPDWLTARPIAHRGLHDVAKGHPENTLAAAKAAIAAGYAIEVDIRPACDATPMIFHDATLERLAGKTGRVDGWRPEDLRQTPIIGSDQCIPCLEDLLEATAGATPLFIEVKSDEPQLRPLATPFWSATAELLAGYRGPAAVMSFDPHCLAAFARLCPQVPRGLVSRRFDRAEDRVHLDPFARWYRRNLIALAETKSAFIAYDATALPSLPAGIARRLGYRLTTWTVRDGAQANSLARHVDQIIFEGFRP